MSISFSLQISGSAFGDDIEAMTAAAVDAEAAGFDEIRVADHPGTTFDPFVLLAHFAARTSDVRLGTYVVNMGVRHPLDVAIAATSLDATSGGRFTLGLGAGHTPAEWTARGGARPDVDGRMGRFLESVETVPALIAGETVDLAGEYVTLHNAIIAKPQAVQKPIPILVGGSNRRLLRWGGAHAQIVGMTGLGRTRADGHRHDVVWAPAATDARVNLVREAASRAGRHLPILDSLVQRIFITDDRQSTAEDFTAKFEELEPSHALDNPFGLIGSADFLADQLLDFQKRWGITSYCVRPDAFDATVEIMAALATRS